MKRYTRYYLIWLCGVFSFAVVAFLYYRRIEAMGVEAAVTELDARRSPQPDPED